MDRDGDNTIVVDREAAFELLTSNVCDPEGERVRVADKSDDEVNDPVAVGTEVAVTVRERLTLKDGVGVCDCVTLIVTPFDRDTVRLGEIELLTVTVTKKESEGELD